MAGLEQTMSTGEERKEQQQTVGEVAPLQQVPLNPSETQRKVVTGKKGVISFLLYTLGIVAFTQRCMLTHIAPNIPLFERRNWLLHLLYVRKDFAQCKVCVCVHVCYILAGDYFPPLPLCRT